MHTAAIPHHPIAPGDTLSKCGLRCLRDAGRLKVYIVTNTEEQSTRHTRHSDRNIQFAARTISGGDRQHTPGHYRYAIRRDKKGRTGKLREGLQRIARLYHPVVSGTPATIKTIVEPAAVGIGRPVRDIRHIRRRRCPVSE